MAKVGITQGNPLAALGNILRKGPGRGSGRDSKSPRRDTPVTKKSSFRGSKESLPENTTDSAEVSSCVGEPKSPKMFRFGIRRSSSRSKKGDKDDSMSDTSSVSSLNVVPVKEEPVIPESSGLAVSQSATLKESSESDQSASASTTEASKSKNRNSTYFKPPEVEALTDLFASGELDALLKPSGVEEGSCTTIVKEQGSDKSNEQGNDKSDMDDQPSNGSSLKRSSLRSSFRMYESRYRAETLEKRKEKSPLAASVSASSKATDSSESQSFSPMLDGERHGPQVSNGCGSVHTELESKGDKEDEEKKEKAGERRRKLFDDELFQSDLPLRSAVQAGPLATTSPSLDAYAKSFKSSSLESRRNVEHPIASEQPLDHPSAVEHTEDESNSDGIAQTAAVGISEPLSTEVSANASLPSTPAEDSVCISLDEDGKKVEPNSPTPVSPKESLAVLCKTQLEKESEERECKKYLCTTEESDIINVQDPHAKAVTEKKEDKQHVNHSKRYEKYHMHKEGLGESASVGGRVKDEKQQHKSPRLARSKDAHSRVESGKVSNARSKFDGASPSASPKVTRAKASTGSSRLSSEGKLKISQEKDSPSWMSDLQRRREQRAKGKESATAVKPSVNDDEDMPDWRKRVLERRKKSAEAHGKLPTKDGQKGQSPTSVRSGKSKEKIEGSTKTEKHPLSSDIQRSPLSSNSKKATSRALKSAEKETCDVATEVNERQGAIATDVQSSENTEETPVSTEDKARSNTNPNDESSGSSSTADTRPSDDCALNSEKSDDLPSLESSATAPKSGVVTSPKPEITSPKPQIDIATRKFIKHSSSSEPVEKSTLCIDIKPSAEMVEAHENVQEKNLLNDDVFASDPTEDATSFVQELSQSPSNLPKPPLAESSETAESRHSSNSPEKEVGVPFRSRGISHSRSPTPTSLSPGPLKLPADTGIPEWKRRVLERKKDPVMSRKPKPVPKSEPELPAWKKELLAKKAKSGDEVKYLHFAYELSM